MPFHLQLPRVQVANQENSLLIQKKLLSVDVAAYDLSKGVPQIQFDTISFLHVFSQM